jgi:hypothetical protein
MLFNSKGSGEEFSAVREFDPGFPLAWLERLAGPVEPVALGPKGDGAPPASASTVSSK